MRRAAGARLLLAAAIGLAARTDSPALGRVSWYTVPAGAKLEALLPAFHRDAELLPVEVDGKWGFVDLKGRLSVEPRFDEVRAFVGGAAAVRTGRLWGVVGGNGKDLVPPSFEDADVLSEGMLAVKRDGLWAFVSVGQIAAVARGKGDLEGLKFRWNAAHPDKFDAPASGPGAFHDGIAVVKVGYHEVFIDRNSQEWAPETLGPRSRFGDGVAGVVVKTDPPGGGITLIDATGRRVGLVKDANEMHGFSEGLAAALSLSHLESETGRWGYVDKTGRWAVRPAYRWAGEFNDGRGRVDTSPGKEPGREGTWGYVDPAGAIAVPAVYLYAGDFWKGFAPVCRKKGQCGFIDKAGKAVVPLEHDVVIGHIGGAFVVGDYEDERSKRMSFSYLRRGGKPLWADAFSVP